MPTANPLEQLRRRMLSHASPAAFAAAAEEHRRAGRLAEAIAVCRDGLERYPAYASARVTLGRALLDSGDPAAAVTELEQAVAQAPDNLAASRALDAARAALGDVPAPVEVAADPVASVSLHAATPLDDDTGEFAAPFLSERPDGGVPPPLPDLASEHLGDALHLGADGPQEFGLGPDWLPTGPGFGAEPVTPAVPPVPPELAALPPFTEDLPASAETGALQGEEPAGIWPAPQLDASAHGAEGAPVYSWALDAADTPAHVGPAPSIWDEPTIEAPLRDVVQTAESAGEGLPPQILDAADGPAAVDEGADASADPGGTGNWSGLFVEPVSDGAAPAAFSGWEAGGPSSREVPTWSEAPEAEPVTSAFTVPGLWGDAPAAEAASARDAWPSADTPLPPASTGPEWHVPAVPVDASAATPEAMGEWTMFVTPVVTSAEAPVVSQDADGLPVSDPLDLELGVADMLTSAPGSEVWAPEAIEPPLEVVAAAETPGPAEPTSAPSPDPVLPSMWDGSVASALGEVFARAGQGSTPTPGHGSLEPPMHPNAEVREAMAAMDVEATLENVAQQAETLPPALVSLQQMLDAVRARRAALHADMKH